MLGSDCINSIFYLSKFLDFFWYVELQRFEYFFVLPRLYKKYNKDQKLELMHIAICTLLEPYGYYIYKGKDDDGYPHWEANELLPPLNAGQQMALMKSCIIAYMNE
jgi:hypothetical protein